jgi:hypothetical protein
VTCRNAKIVSYCYSSHQGLKDIVQGNVVVERTCRQQDRRIGDEHTSSDEE